MSRNVSLFFRTDPVNVVPSDRGRMSGELTHHLCVKMNKFDNGNKGQRVSSQIKVGYVLGVL